MYHSFQAARLKRKRLSLFDILLLSFVVLGACLAVTLNFQLEFHTDAYLFVLLWVIQVTALLFSISLSEKIKGFSWLVCSTAIFFALVNLNLYFYWAFNGWFFEYVGSDSYRYALFANDLSLLAMSDWPGYMAGTKYDFQDFGMPFFKAGLFVAGFGEYGTRQINAFIALVTGYFVYHSIYFSCGRRRFARVFTTLYLMNPITVYYASSGLKETLFAFFISLHFYGFLRLYQARWFIGSALGAAAVPFFRLPTALSMVCSQLLAIATMIKNETLRKASFVLSIFFVGFTIVVNLDAIWETTHFVKRIGAGKYTGQGLLETASLFVSGIIGPFPTFDLIGPDFSQSQYFTGTFLKMLLAPLFFIGILATWKTFREHFAIAIFCSLGVISLLAIGETLKVRYHMVYWPQFVILASIGYLQVVQRKQKPLLIILWISFCVFLTITWNLYI